MNDQAMAAQQLAAITDNLAALFADYCQRNVSPGLAVMLEAYRAQRLDLVLTVHASMGGADFACCALPVGGGPADLVQLFTVHTVPAAPAGKAH
ncbi:MAG: hypothetical protein A3J49_04375 [Gallionellales bacterium RIFCSPHIGHO2_02_FULL_57_16]|nr:MAG: hypothetical protein A3J49_04375 [Gallionellales bacterium RIFCSPHIGHO2_02_FULL_57_16]